MEAKKKTILGLSIFNSSMHQSLNKRLISENQVFPKMMVFEVLGMCRQWFHVINIDPKPLGQVMGGGRQFGNTY